MQAILLLRGGALGDFIVTLPLLEALRKRWPGARIELAGNKLAAQLAIDAGLLDVAYDQNEARWASLYTEGPLAAPFDAWLAEFDLIISFWPDPLNELNVRFPRRPAQVFLSGAAHPEIAPAAAHYLQPAAQLGITKSPRNVIIRDELPSANRVAIHPGSGSPQKNWPLANWNKLAHLLRSDFGAEVIVISGIAEAQKPLGAEFDSRHNLPLAELADLLASCWLFIGHDSGVSHLAAACGTPSLILFGPTEPAMWAPPALHVHVLKEGQDLKKLSLESVLRQLRVILLPAK